MTARWREAGTQGVRPSIEAMTRVKSLVVNLRERDLRAL
jgi:hypothetical protein